MAVTNKRKNLNISQNICVKKVKHFRNESNTTLATSNILNEIDPSSKYADVGGISSIRVVNTQTTSHDERITTNISPVLDENLINLNPLSPILGNEFYCKITQTNQVTVHGADHEDLNAKNTAKISSKLNNVRSIHPSSLEIVNSSNFDMDPLEICNYPNRDQELLRQLPVLNSPMHKILPVPTNIDNLEYIPVNDTPKSPVLDSRQYNQISAKPKTPIKDTWFKLKSNYFENRDSNHSFNQFEANVLIENPIASERCQNGFEHTNNAIRNSDETRNDKVSSATQFKPTFIHSSIVEDRPLSPILDSSQSRSKMSCVTLPCAQSVAGIPTTSGLLNTFEPKNAKTNVNHPMNHLHKHRPDSIVSREKILDTRIDPELFTSDSLLINKSKPLSPILDSSECKNDFTLKSSRRTSSESQLFVKNMTNFKALSTKNNNLVNKSPHLVYNGESMLNIYNEHESILRSDQRDLKLSEKFSLDIFNLSPKLTYVSCRDLNNKSSCSPRANIESIQPQDCRNKLLRSLDLDSSCLITNCNNFFKPAISKELNSSFDSSEHHSLCVRGASNERSPILSDINLENPLPGSSIRNFTSTHIPMLSSRPTHEGYERLEVGEISPSTSIRAQTSKDELSICSKTNKRILPDSCFELDFPKVKPQVQTSLVQLSSEHKSQLSSDELMFTSNDSNEAPGVDSAQKECGYNVKMNQTNKEEYSISAESASSLSTVKRKLNFNHVDVDNVVRSQDERIQLFITSPQQKENLARHEVKRHLNGFKNTSLNKIDQKNDLIIEEFDDSPSKSDINISFRESQITIVNERLSPCLDAPHKIKSQNFDRQNLKNINKLDVMDDVQDCFHALEKLDFEANIEEDLSQESVKSNVYKIECSTSPLTKSYEGTESLEIVSFPPALDVATTSCDSKAVDVLDSACKTKKLKVKRKPHNNKRGSLLERLRRVVRAEKAEVNMFHHEAHVSQQEGVCLRVNGIMKTASRLVLTCKYACRPKPNCSDPEIKLIIKPDFIKKITVDSNILVYPPWKSEWLDSRQVLLLYRVSKVRLSPEISVPSSTLLNLNQPILIQKFSCTPQTAECGCLKELMNQLFLVPQSSQGTGPTELSVSAALSDPRPPQHVTIKFNVLHRFSTRYINNVVQSLLCLDGDSCIFQFNLPTPHDVKKAELLLGETSSGTFLVNDVTLCNNIFIDGCKGLRSMLTTLKNDSTNQQLMYIVYPSSEHWTVRPDSSLLLNAKQTSRLPTLAEAQGASTESRVECEVQVLALGADQLYAWDWKESAQIKLKLDPAAVLPNLVVRANLMIRYLRFRLGLLTIDQFSTVTVKESEGELSCSPPIPFLGLTSQPGDLVFIDAVVSRVVPDVQLRWEGPCGHSLVRMPEPPVFFCQSCYRPTECCRQRIVMEVGTVAIDLLPPVRVKVKSETAHLLLDIPGELTSAKKYNMIRAIGASLKCLAVVVEILKNPFGDILEIYVEEL